MDLGFALSFVAYDLGLCLIVFVCFILCFYSWFDFDWRVLLFCVCRL